jgi:hypothetical protein
MFDTLSLGAHLGAHLRPEASAGEYATGSLIFLLLRYGRGDDDGSNTSALSAELAQPLLCKLRRQSHSGYRSLQRSLPPWSAPPGRSLPEPEAEA